jgi:hypothetical protein
MAFNRSAFGKELFRGFSEYLTGKDPMERLAKKQKELRDQFKAKQEAELQQQKIELQIEAEQRRIDELVRREVKDAKGYSSDREENIHKSALKLAELKAASEAGLGKEVVKAGSRKDVAEIKLEGTKYRADAGGESKIKVAEIGAGSRETVADTRAKASRYGADAGAKSRKYSADVAAESRGYAADASAGARGYAADVAAGSREAVAKTRKEATQYSADRGYGARKYVVDAATKAKRYVADELNKSREKMHGETIGLKRGVAAEAVAVKREGIAAQSIYWGAKTRLAEEKYKTQSGIEIAKSMRDEARLVLEQLDSAHKRSTGTKKQELEQKIGEARIRLNESSASLKEQEHSLIGIGKDSATLDRKFRETKAARAEQLDIMGFNVELQKQRNQHDFKRLENAKDRGLASYLKSVSEYGLSSRFTQRLRAEQSQIDSKRRYDSVEKLAELSRNTLKEQEELRILTARADILERKLEDSRATEAGHPTLVKQMEQQGQRLQRLISAKNAYLRELDITGNSLPTIQNYQNIFNSAQKANDSAKGALRENRAWGKYSQLVADSQKPTSGGLFGHNQESAKAELAAWLGERPEFQLLVDDMKTAGADLDKYTGMLDSALSGETSAELSEEQKGVLDAYNEAITEALKAPNTRSAKKKLTTLQKEDPVTFNVVAGGRDEPIVKEMYKPQVADGINGAFRKYPSKRGALVQNVREFLLETPHMIDQLKEELEHLDPAIKPYIVDLLKELEGE